MKKIFLIDYASSDNAGSYVDELIKASAQINQIKAFTSFDYKYSKENTFRLFDFISSKVPFSFLKKVSKYFEMWFSFLIITTYLTFFVKGKKLVLISLYQTFNTYLVLVKLLRLSGIEVAIIVHDLIPLHSNYPKIVMAKQENILRNSNYLIVHNNHSKSGLIHYNILIYQFRFPLLKPYNFKPKPINSRSLKFLFLGHVRKEKGIDLLLDAWKMVSKMGHDIELTIAGKGPKDIDLEISELQSIKRINKYLSDTDYFNLIHQCDYGVLPYTGGTNSGVLSTFTTLSKPVITSNILLFRESKLTTHELEFEAGSAESLAIILNKLILDKDRSKQLKKNVNKIRTSYQSGYINEVNRVLKEIS